jgi:predicted nucleic acid-binding Zn ribbon protein
LAITILNGSRSGHKEEILQALNEDSLEHKAKTILQDKASLAITILNGSISGHKEEILHALNEDSLLAC